MSGRARILANFALFQVGWFACVLSGGGEIDPWAGPASALLILAVHLVMTPRGKRFEEMVAIGIITAGGCLLDVLNVSGGFLEYRGAGTDGSGIPLWVVSLWALFASMFNVALRWLQRRPLLTAICTAIGSPLSYLAGERLDAVTIVEPRIWSAVALGASWAVFVTVALTLRGLVAAAREDAGTGPTAADIE